MYRLKFLLHTVLLHSCHFLQPFWGAREWAHIVKFFAGKKLVNQVSGLEEAVVRLTQARYALGLNLGRSAIQVALEAFNFPRGSEVILPAFSCAGVVMPVVQAGLEPVLADVDQDFNLSAASVAAGLSPKTCAIILPHLSGKFARDTDKILGLARLQGVKVIEDACQAFGLRRDGKWAGTFGDVGIFSFGLGKNLFGPGGGMLVTDDDRVIAYGRSRNLPQEDPQSVSWRLAKFVARYGFPRGTVLARGAAKAWNLCLPPAPPEETLESFAYPVCRLSEIEAALAWCQVERHQEIICRRQENARALMVSGALGLTGLDLPDPDQHIFTKFLLSTVENQQAAVSLRKLLSSCGIETEPSYTPLHLRPPFARFKRTDLSETARRWSAAFSIPVHPRLRRRDLDRIIRVAKRFHG